MTLVGLDVNDEDESVVLLNLLHGRFSVQRVNDGAVSIHTGEREDSLALVLGLAGESKGLGSALVDGCSRSKKRQGWRESRARGGVGIRQVDVGNQGKAEFREFSSWVCGRGHKNDRRVE